MSKKTESPETALVKVAVNQIVPVREIAVLWTRAQGNIKEAMALTIKDLRTATEKELLDVSDRANIYGPKVKGDKKDLEALRKGILKDPKDFTDKVNGVMKPMAGHCDDATNHLNGIRRSVEAELNRRQAEAEAKAAKKEETAQKISIAKGGDGSRIKPVPRPVMPKTATKKRRIPDLEHIERVIRLSAEKMKPDPPMEIAGVSIWWEPKFQVIDNKELPDEFKKDSIIG